MANVWMHNGLMQAGSAAGKVGGRPREAGETDETAADAATQAATKISKSTGA